MFWLLLIAPLFFVLWMLLAIRFINGVSRGTTIKGRGQTALLLIDLQKDFWEDNTFSAETKARVNEAIVQAVAEAKRNAQPVIALRQEWSTPGTRLLCRLMMQGKGLAGTPGTAMAAPFDTLPDHVLVKRVQDGFETGALDALLSKLDIAKLRIMGLDGLYCVNKTAQAALNRGYETELLEAGIATAIPEKFDGVRKVLRDLGARFV